jgi:hypothetical protein
MAADIGASELKLVLILLCLVVIPIALVAFARSGKGLESLGKGPWSIDREAPRAAGEGPAADPAEREAEVRQMVEAADFRRRNRGEGQLDVVAETDRLLGIAPEDEPDPADPLAGDGPAERTGSGETATDDEAAGGGHGGVRDEVRQLVVANNERRERRGEAPLDVEAEVERRLREWS